MSWTKAQPWEAWEARNDYYHVDVVWVLLKQFDDVWCIDACCWFQNVSDMLGFTDNPYCTWDDDPRCFTIFFLYLGDGCVVESWWVFQVPSWHVSHSPEYPCAIFTTDRGGESWRLHVLNWGNAKGTETYWNNQEFPNFPVKCCGTPVAVPAHDPHVAVCRRLPRPRQRWRRLGRNGGPLAVATYGSWLCV